MDTWLNRTKLLIGDDNLQKLKNSHVAVFGCGGVGSYVIEGLVRSGVGNITIVDNDIIDITNINRQLIADTTVIGKPKVDVEKDRLLKINPNLNIITHKVYIDSSNVKELVTSDHTYIVDAIDSITSKLELIVEANKKNIPIISSMGTGNKLDPTKFEITDISKTSVCPLAKVMRKELKNRNITHLKVVYSKEEPNRFRTQENSKHTLASISFVPSVAGLIISGEVIKDLLDL